MHPLIPFLTTSLATNVNGSVPLMDTRSYGSLDSTAPPKSPSTKKKVLMNCRELESGVSATSSDHKICTACKHHDRLLYDSCLRGRICTCCKSKVCINGSRIAMDTMRLVRRFDKLWCSRQVSPLIMQQARSHQKRHSTVVVPLQPNQEFAADAQSAFYCIACKSTRY